MNKLFRPKCLRRVLLCLALLFPIVYLCGGLFFALAGAHGNMTLADVPQDVEISASIYSKNTMNAQGVEIPSNNARLTNVMPLYKSTFTIDIQSEHLTGIYIAYYDDTQSFISRPALYESANEFTNYINDITSPNNAKYCKILILMTGSSYVVSSSTLIFNGFGDTPYWEGVTMSDYLFSQPFVNDNFIASLGRRVLDDTAFGFPPFRDMFNWFNDSVMHIESDDALGVFGLGYAYYALNVVAVYELVVLVMMVFLLPLRITDKFMGENL